MKGLPFLRVANATRDFLWCSPALALLLSLIPQFAHAQDTASISGTVIDKSGAAVVGARGIDRSAGGNRDEEYRQQTEKESMLRSRCPPAGRTTLASAGKGLPEIRSEGLKVDVAQKAARRRHA